METFENLFGDVDCDQVLMQGFIAYRAMQRILKQYGDSLEDCIFDEMTQCRDEIVKQYHENCAKAEVFVEEFLKTIFEKLSDDNPSDGTDNFSEDSSSERILH